MVVAMAFYYQGAVGPTLETDLGFKHSTPYIYCDDEDDYIEVTSFEEVVPGGVFHRAGGRENDVLMEPSGLTHLFFRLHHGRGETVTISVVREEFGTPLDERTVHVLRLNVPE